MTDMITSVVIVPYRDRAKHMEEFIPVMHKTLPLAGIVVVEQADDKPFNRGKLINIGFLESRGDYIIAHDVDMLPVDVDYSGNGSIVQLAESTIQRTGYLGGVTLYPREVFQEAGGYNNEYFHRAEDNEMMFNLQRLTIPVMERFGIFEFLPHKRQGPEFIPHLWFKAQQRRKIQNQLSSCSYTLISRQEKENYTLLKVIL